MSLGSINVDVQVRAERWPAQGELMPGRDFLLASGGKAANRAYVARQLGVDAQLIARTGDDTLARHALQPLAALGVDLRHTTPVAQCATGVAMILVWPNAAKSILLAANANAHWSTAEAADVAHAITEAGLGAVLAVDLEVPADIVTRAVHTARQQGVRVLVDPSPAERFCTEWYPLVDYLTPNASEAERLTGVAVAAADDAARAGAVLLERGIGTALVKLPHGGCVVVSHEGHQHIAPPRHVHAVDTTGAGDAFAGALAVALLEGRPLEEAARFAVAVATFSITKYGSQNSYPSRAALAEFLS
jgi:ribokinase